MTRFRPLILLIALLIALGLALAAAVYLWRLGDTASVQGTSGEAGAAAQGTGTPSIGGPFTLTDQTGKRVSQADYAGKYMLIYFGFTFCPDVCPTELQVMSGALAALGPDAAKVQPIFITVDPERDTAPVLAQYVTQFDPRLVGLTGSPAEIAAVAKEYRVYFEKVKDKESGDDYTMDHSSVVYLMGPDGHFLAFFPPATAPEKMAEKIKSLM